MMKVNVNGNIRCHDFVAAAAEKIYAMTLCVSYFRVWLVVSNLSSRGLERKI